MTFDTSMLQETLGASLGAMTLQGLLSTLMVLVVCLIAARILRGIAGRLLDKTRLDSRMKKFILSGVRLLLYVLVVMIVADSMGIPITSLIALVSVFGLAVSLAVQDVLSNVASGMVILFSKPFAIGDYVDTGDGEGEVVEISMTHTKLDTPQGQRVMLPNSKLVAGKIVNYTARGVRRVDHAVSASYDCSVQDVRKACLEAVERTPGVSAEPRPVVLVSKYGDSAIEYTVRFWTAPEKYWDAYSCSLEELRASFDENGVEMTYNHLNVHIVEK